MPVFPSVENEVLALAHSMREGYLGFPGVFPNADVAGLDAALAAFEAASEDYTRLDALAAVAAKAKAEQLAALKAFMKVQLRQSEADTAGDPIQLECIGWAPRAKRRAVRAPGQPLALTARADDRGAVHLKWRNAARGGGGRVRVYLVLRRRDDPETGFGEWELASSVFDKQAVLSDQPRGVRFEYRIVAVNPGGQSVPSGTATVVV